MANPSKAKGTQGEVAVVKAYQARGLPARRLPLAGNKDIGDVDCGVDGIVTEVKAGRAAEQASDGQVVKWLQETATEVRNAKAKVGVLVMKRKGVGNTNAQHWWAITTIRELDILMGTENPLPPVWYYEPVRMHLSTFIGLVLTFAQRERKP